MNEKLRKSTPARITAIGFILIVIAGNFWLVNILMNTTPHMAVVWGMQIGVLMVFMGAIGLAYLGLFGEKTEYIDEPDGNDQNDE